MRSFREIIRSPGGLRRARLRQRVRWFGGLLALMVLGLWFRFSAPVPEWLRDGAGGALYVVFWMFAVLVVKPETPALPLAVGVFLATCVVEFSQAWHTEWLDRIRSTLPGRLVLGTTFDWSDFSSYAIGAVVGWGVFRQGQRRQR